MTLKFIIFVSKSNTRDMVHLWCSSVNHNTTKNHMKGAPLYGDSPIWGNHIEAPILLLLTKRLVHLTACGDKIQCN